MNNQIERIVYAASTMGENSFAELFKNSPAMPGQQAQKYNRLLQQGIKLNGVEVIAISTPPVTVVNTTKKMLKVKNSCEKGVLYKYTPVINIRAIKNIVFTVSSFLKGLRFLFKKKSAVVCDILNVSASIGTISAAKVLHRPVIGIVTDIPELMVTGHSKKQVELCHSIISKCDGYVFMTEPMNERLNSSHKPYTIIEGIADVSQINIAHNKNNHIKKCMYAGLLDAEYGVKSMVEGFLSVDVRDTELHLFGSGPYVEELKEVLDAHKNIVFHGSVLNSEVVRMEKECDLLINPRPSVGEFTKFSFPSKIMEYMSSGTATMATRLPGIPNEYYDYLIPIEKEDSEGIKTVLSTVLKSADYDLENKGKKAQSWITENKNSKKQGERILDLISRTILGY